MQSPPSHGNGAIRFDSCLYITFALGLPPPSLLPPEICKCSKAGTSGSRVVAHEVHDMDNNVAIVC